MSTIPDDLMARFHEANENFHRTRLRMSELDHMTLADRQDLASALREAEREVEAVTDEVSRVLAQEVRPPTPPGAGA
jgi:hypothetical protein